jgi:uncharacterized protein YwgA
LNDLNRLKQQRGMLLLIAHLAKKVSGKTRFQKLAFLIQQEGKSPLLSALFNFEPYYYGPYSDELNRVLSQLTQEGLIHPDPYIFVAQGRARMGSSFLPTAEGHEEAKRLLSSLPREEVLRVQALVDRFRYEPMPKLLEYVYKTYPHMAINSKAKEAQSDA